jgi:hypothetical protein
VTAFAEGSIPIQSVVRLMGMQYRGIDETGRGAGMGDVGASGICKVTPDTRYLSGQAYLTRSINVRKTASNATCGTPLRTL